MIWADRIAKQIIDSGKYKPYRVDDMKTPSGRIHVGSLRGVLIHELVWRALKDADQGATFTYVFDDHDPMDALPHYLDKKIWEKYLGQPLFTIPSPEKGADNYAQFYSHEFISVFNKLGCNPQILWTSAFYKTGKMNEYIRLCLDKVVIIRGIYEEMYKKKLPTDWYPFQVVCSKCGKESTTKVTAWDGKKVTFICKDDAVPWTKGCNYSGKISPYSGEGKFIGKLSWKVEWPVKWQVIGVTIEGAGKDHMSAGGSHDIAKLICERVLKYPVPYPIPYEFFLLKGRKMSSSKGLGSSSKEVSEIIPPYLLRFLFTRTDYKQAIDFEPLGTMVIPDLFDEYDRCWQAYNQNLDQDLGRTFEMSQIKKIPAKDKNLFISRFIDVANYVQNLPQSEIANKFDVLKGQKLTYKESEILQERISYALIWLKKYAPSQMQYQVESAKEIKDISLTDSQKQYLKEILLLLEKHTEMDSLNLALYQKAKELSIYTKDAFSAIYLSLLGKTHGPRAAYLLLSSKKELIRKRINNALQSKQKEQFQKSSLITISRPDLFTIDPEVKKVYPSISIGIAIIKGVNIEKLNSKLEEEKKQFLLGLAGLTTEQLGKYPEILSYRKLYKEMDIDWHSRRPSPEALLRRIALNKGLYSINTCVDAYNLVVMKHRVSVGAFDLDSFKFPTVLRFPKEGEEILLLGDKKPTKYTTKELAYFDQVGGYNIDFNFRDAQRTAVRENTKNLFINIDGVYDITPEKVQRSLHESTELITKYCGGKVELEGVVL